MKRSPIVAVGTVVGLASVLNFHSSPAKISLSAVTNTPTTTPITTTTTKKQSTSTTTAPAPTTTVPAPTTTVRGSHTTTSAPRATTTTAGAPTTTAPPRTTTTTAATTTTVAPTTTTVASTGVRTVTGPQVNYFYGVLSVKVTANGKKITAVTIGSITDGGNPLSQQIDQYSVPILSQEAMAAQSSSIQSVSGASYTSAGYQMSLQYALKKLGI